MKTMKTMLAALLAAVLLLSLAACHPANETAVTVGDTQVPAGIYLCALIQADGEGRNKVDSAKAAESTDSTASTTSGSSTATEIDYYDEKIDDTDFTKWVKDYAMKIVTEYAVYTDLFNKAGLKLDEATLKEIDSAVDYYWNTYGYSEIYEPNGVSFASYKEFYTYSYRVREYFMSIYGEGGAKEIAADELNKAISDNFAVAKVLTVSYNTTDSDGKTTTLSDDEIQAIKDRVATYGPKLEGGESFKKLYLTEHPETSENTTETKTDADENTTTDYCSIFVSEAAQPFCSSQYYSYEYFEEVKALQVGKAYTAHNTDDNYSVVLYKAQDVLSYTDYQDSLKETAMYILKQEEFEADVQTIIDGTKVSTNDYAIDRFKPKNIEYPVGAA